MLGLFVNFSDDCTYSFDEVRFVFNENQRTSSAFVQKVLEFYPQTDEDSLLELQTADIDEMNFVTVKYKDGYSYSVIIQKIESL